MNEELFKLDRKTISFSKLDDKDDDLEFWLSKTPAEKLKAVELLRILMFCYDPAAERLQQVFEMLNSKQVEIK